jgi:hypothetical protein
MAKRISRRKFLDSSLKAGIAAAGTGLILTENVNGISTGAGEYKYDAKGLPTAFLGKTGVAVPRIAIGLGSRFLTIKSTDEALEMCNYALDNGL